MNIKKTFLVLYDRENEVIATPLIEYFNKSVPDHYVVAFDDSIFDGTKKARARKNFSNFLQKNLTDVYKINEKIICDSAVKKALKYNGSKQDTTYEYKGLSRAILEKRYKRFINIYTRFLTDTVFCVSPRAAELALKVREFRKAEYKVFCYHTELSLNPRYIQPKADGFFVPNEKVKDSLIKLGIPAEIISVIGFPTLKNSGFDKEKAKEALGIKTDLPIILFSGGTYRYKSLKPYFAEFLNMTDKYALVVNTGASNSEKFRKIISEKTESLGSEKINKNNVYYFKNNEKNFDIRIADIAIINSDLSDIYKLLGDEIPTIVINPLFDRERDMINQFQLKQLLFYACYPYSAKEIIFSHFSGEDLNEHKQRLSLFKYSELLSEKALPKIDFEKEENIVLEGGTKLQKSTNAPEIEEKRKKESDISDFDENLDFTPLDDDDDFSEEENDDEEKDD